MANPRYLWVRDAVSDSTDHANPNTGYYNLLWKARTGENIQGSNAAVLREPRALFTTDVQPQDLTNAVVKRIRCRIGVALAPLPVVLADGTNLDIWTNAGFYVGIRTGLSSLAGYGDTDDVTHNPGSDKYSVLEDWLWWDRLYAIGYETLAEAPVQGFSGYLISRYTVDTKCSRALDEWDETLLLCVSPSSGRTINHVSASWSVLLQTAS